MLNKGALESPGCQLATQHILKSESRRLHDAVFAFLRLHREIQPQNNWSGSRLGDTTLCIYTETFLKCRYALITMSNFEWKRLWADSWSRHALLRTRLPCIDLKPHPHVAAHMRYTKTGISLSKLGRFCWIRARWKALDVTMQNNSNGM